MLEYSAGDLVFLALDGLLGVTQQFMAYTVLFLHSDRKWERIVFRLLLLARMFFGSEVGLG